MHTVHTQRAAAAALAAAVMLASVLCGCSHDPVLEAAPNALLTLVLDTPHTARTAHSRTVLPDAEQALQSADTVTLTGNGPGGITVSHTWQSAHTTAAEPAVLGSTGAWDFTVTVRRGDALLCTGTKESFNVQPGMNELVIALVPAQEGTGRFEAVITVPNGVTAVQVSLTPISADDTALPQANAETIKAADGSARYEKDSLAAGTYLFTVCAEGLTAYRETVYIAAGCTSTAAAALVQAGQQEGGALTLDEAKEYLAQLTPSDTPQHVALTGITNESVTELAELLGAKSTGDAHPLVSLDLSKCTELTMIETGAFKNCVYLYSAVLPTTLTALQPGAFQSCVNLTEITLPPQLESIKGTVFGGCTRLTRFITDGNSSFTSSGGMLLSADGTRLYAFPSASGSVTLPDTITVIGTSSFSLCSKLTHIDLPNKLDTIQASAFQFCSGLERITIPSSVTSIGADAFFNCTQLAAVIMHPKNSPTQTASSFANIAENAVLYVPDSSITTYKDKALYKDCFSDIKPISELNQ